MKADRLVATLLILQRKGTATASEIAEELEVSERTSRRDLEALSIAGVPVYSRQGRGGGWSLVGGARTDLSGLTAAEARALFLVVGPSSTASDETKSALRKLVQALPETFRSDAEAAAGAVRVDSSVWGRSGAEEPEFLGALQAAVIESNEIMLGYARPDSAQTERAVDPLGLISKRGIWYLVAITNRGRRTFRVDRVSSVELTGAKSARPPDFDLDAAWTEINAEVAELYSGVKVRCLVDPASMRYLRAAFRQGLTTAGTTADGQIEAEVTVSSIGEAVGRLGGFGSSVQVVSPAEVIDELRRVAQELTALYA